MNTTAVISRERQTQYSFHAIEDGLNKESKTATTPAIMIAYFSLSFMGLHLAGNIIGPLPELVPVYVNIIAKSKIAKLHYLF